MASTVQYSSRTPCREHAVHLRAVYAVVGIIVLY